MTLQRMTVHYKGRLQDIGFPFTAENLAKRFGVGGMMENRPDGSIELIIEGFENQLKELLTAIRLSHLERYILSEQIFRAAATGEFKGHFCVKH